MKVLIAGASGALGIPLTRALIAKGHEVLGLARSPESRNHLSRLGIYPIQANVMDRDDLLRAVKGMQADAVIHALTALKKTRRVSLVGNQWLLRPIGKALSRPLRCSTSKNACVAWAQGNKSPSLLWEEAVAFLSILLDVLVSRSRVSHPRESFHR